MVLQALLIAAAGLAAAATPLTGDFADVSSPGRGVYRFADHPGAVFVVHHVGVEVCCNGHLGGPTKAALEYNKMVADYKVSAGSRLQVLDVGGMPQDEYFTWWVGTTAPTHPVLVDKEKVLTGQLASAAWPDVVIVDCHGEVKYHQHLYTTPTVYEKELKPVIDAALADPTCGTEP